MVSLSCWRNRTEESIDSVPEVTTRMPAFSTQLLEKNPFQRIKHIPGQPLSYLQNPKVATKSLELSLWRAHDPDGAPENPHAVRQGPFIRHSRELSEESFVSLMRSKFFSVVRNPYSRFLSAYLNKVRRGPWLKMSQRFGMAPESKPSIHQLLVAMKELDVYKIDHHFRPQHLNLLNGFVPLDFVGYFETIGRVESFLQGYGFVFATNRKNATDASARVSELLDERAIDLIQGFYRDDFELYGYSLDPNNLEPVKAVTSANDEDRSALRDFLLRSMNSQTRVVEPGRV